MYASAKAAEDTFDRNVTGKNNVALDADNEPMFYGIPRRHRFTMALESLQTLFTCHSVEYTLPQVISSFQNLCLGRISIKASLVSRLEARQGRVAVLALELVPSN
jgi:hypothetical protein